MSQVISKQLKNFEYKFAFFDSVTCSENLKSEQCILGPTSWSTIWEVPVFKSSYWINKYLTLLQVKMMNGSGQTVLMIDAGTGWKTFAHGWNFQHPVTVSRLEEIISKPSQKSIN